MGKYQNDDMLDAALDYIKNNATKLTVCSSQPTNYNEAVNAPASSGYALADVVVDSTDFTHAAGDTSGRKTTVAQQSDILIDVTGTAQHIALVGTIASVNTLLYVTTCTSQSLTAANNVTVPAWDIELRDAA